MPAPFVRNHIHYDGIMSFQIYPWTKIQEAHREMEANKNRFVKFRLLRAVLANTLNSVEKSLSK